MQNIYNNVILSLSTLIFSPSFFLSYFCALYCCKYSPSILTLPLQNTLCILMLTPAVHNIFFLPPYLCFWSPYYEKNNESVKLRSRWMLTISLDLWNSFFFCSLDATIVDSLLLYLDANVVHFLVVSKITTFKDPLIYNTLQLELQYDKKFPALF